MNISEFFLSNKIQYGMLAVFGIIGSIMMNAFYLTELSILQMMFLTGLGLIISFTYNTHIEITMDLTKLSWYDLGYIFTILSLVCVVIVSIQ